MYSKRFEKETFKNDVKENVRTLYRKEIEEATPQIFSSAFIVAKRQIAFFKRSHIRCQSKWFTAGHH